MITATPSGAVTAHLQVALAPAASGPAELRDASGDDDRLAAFPRALQRSVDEPAPVPARPARATVAPPADRKPQVSTNVRAPGAVGDDTDKLLAELGARHGLRTKVAAEDLSRTAPAYGLKPPPVARRPPTPAPGAIDLPPSDGDPLMRTPPFHDQPGAPMPRDAGGELAPAAPQSASNSATAPLQGRSATLPAAAGTAPLGGPHPAVPRPRSDAGPRALQPLPAPVGLVAPPADGDVAGSTPLFHDLPGAPMPRDTVAHGGAAAAAPRSASTPAAAGTGPLGGPHPAVPRPRSEAGPRPLQPLPVPVDLVAPPADGDVAGSTPPFHDRPGAPMPRGAAAHAGPAAAAPRSVSTFATTPWQGRSATLPAAEGTLPLGTPNPAVPWPRSDADPRALQPLPARIDHVASPADGDVAWSTPPFHDRPGAPMPRDTAAQAVPAAAAAGTGLRGGPHPAVPRPRSDAGPRALQPLPAPIDTIAPSADGDAAVSTPPLHDRPGAPMPRDTGNEAAPAIAVPAEARAPDLAAGLDTEPRFSPNAETLGAAGHRKAKELTAGQQAAGQPVAAVAPDAAHTAAQSAVWAGAGQATAAGIVAPQVPAADDESARRAGEAGSTPLAPSLPLGQALAPAGISTSTAIGTPAEARLMGAPGSADFSSQLGAQLTTFVREGVQHARLHLHPAELGPVTVHIQIEGQAAQVHMAAEHALTRQALEQSMPMLAGSLREAGLTLSGGGVFEQPRQRDGGDAPGQPGADPGNAPGGDRSSETTRRTATGMPARRGVVDLVA